MSNIVSRGVGLTIITDDGMATTEAWTVDEAMAAEVRRLLGEPHVRSLAPVQLAVELVEDPRYMGLT